jgi:hypothetical protein
MADPRKFILNSDYPAPALVAKWEYSFTVPAYGWVDKEFNHNLPFMPLIIGYWSVNSDFAISHDISSLSVSFFDQACGSTSTKIKFKVNNNENAAKTFYYRLFAFAPSDYDGDIPAIEDSTNYRLNSDFNYPKLFAYGSSDLTSGQAFNVYHNLGYIPMCRVWVYNRQNDFCSPTTSAYYEDGSRHQGTTISSSKLTYYGAGAKIYYQIYADEF